MTSWPTRTHNQVADKIARADALAGMATRQFRAWHFLSAATNARMAYAQIARAAAMLGIETPTSMVAQSARIGSGAAPHEDPGPHAEQLAAALQHPVPRPRGTGCFYFFPAQVTTRWASSVWNSYSAPAASSQMVYPGVRTWM